MLGGNRAQSNSLNEQPATDISDEDDKTKWLAYFTNGSEAVPPATQNELLFNVQAERNENMLRLV